MSADDGSDVAEVARFVEEAVFEAAFGQSEEDMESEYGPFRSISTLHLMIDLQSRRPAVSARVLWGSGDQLKAVVDSRQMPEWGVGWSEIAEFHGHDERDVACEIATLSVLPEYRSVQQGWAVKAILGNVMHNVLGSGASAMVVTFCEASTRLINRIDAFDFERICDLPDAVHVGAVSWNGLLDLRSYKARWTRDRPDDPEFAALIQRYDETGRGGTQLPPIDLRHEGLVARLVRERAPWVETPRP